MGRTLTILPALLAVILMGAAQAQSAEPRDVMVWSWQKGAETVFPQTIRLTLGPHQSEYTTEILGRSGKRYQLGVVHNPLDGVRTEHWLIKLREVLPRLNGAGEVLGPNLLGESSPDPGRDYFPREDLAAYLYPERGPAIVHVGGLPYVEGHPFYPIRTVRRIRVEGFYLIARVSNYQFNDKVEGRLDFLDLSIELQNADEQKPPTPGCKS